MRLRLQRTGVAGHEDQGVAEVDLAVAGGKHQPTGVQHVQQRAHHFLAGFFDFIKQHNAGFAERALYLVQIEQAVAFLAAHVARRCTGQGCGVMLLGQGVHVDTAQAIAITVDGFGNEAHGFGFAHAGRTQEQVHRQRPVVLADIGFHPHQHGFHGRQGLILADDIFPQSGHHGLGLEAEPGSTNRA